MNQGNPSLQSQIVAVFRYEYFRNLRKRKLLSLFVFSFLLVSLFVFLAPLVGYERPDPNFVVKRDIGLGGLLYALLGIAVAMDAISEEFERDTISTLLSKPVSRTVVYVGKFFFLCGMLAGVYFFLYMYFFVGEWIMYGPQNGMQLFLVVPLAAVLSTLVWVSITLFIGSATKNSTMAALGTFAVLCSILIVGGLAESSAAGKEMVDYLPGLGHSAFIADDSLPEDATYRNISLTTGIDKLSPNIILYAYAPSAEAITVTKPDPESQEEPIVTTQPLSRVILRAGVVAALYVVVLNVLSWALFRNTEIL